MQDTIAAAREIDCGFATLREQREKGRKPGRMQDTIAAAREIVASNCVSWTRGKWLRSHCNSLKDFLCGNLHDA